ncbi:hypothetical protein JJ691_65210 [Kutzneria sp. CA-103260]|nr:hypothetical protein JJ691_65210 [Kutzneria sp. CA-103260]
MPASTSAFACVPARIPRRAEHDGAAAEPRSRLGELTGQLGVAVEEVYEVLQTNPELRLGYSSDQAWSSPAQRSWIRRASS